VILSFSVPLWTNKSSEKAGCHTQDLAVGIELLIFNQQNDIGKFFVVDVLLEHKVISFKISAKLSNIQIKI
jgi:hypothetical protein